MRRILAKKLCARQRINTPARNRKSFETHCQQRLITKHRATDNRSGVKEQTSQTHVSTRRRVSSTISLLLDDDAVRRSSAQMPTL